MDKTGDKFEVLVEGIREAISIIDAAGKFHFMNQSAAAQVGGRPADYVAKSLWDIFPANLADEFASHVRKVIQTGEGLVTETRQPLQGEWRWHRTYVEPLRGPDGSVTTALVMAKDITDLKVATDALGEAELRYRALVEQIPAITYTAPLDQTSGVLFISPQVTEVLGFTLEECKNDPDLWRRQLHPDDRDRVLSELAHSRRAADQFVSEYRLLAKDGRVKWFRDEARFVFDPDGRPLYQQGVMLDITGQKSAQEAARRTDKLFHELFDCSPIGMTLFDSRGKFVNANPAAREIFGVREQRQDLGYSVLHDPLFPADALARLAGGDSVRFEAVYDFDRARRERIHDTCRTGIAHLDLSVTPLIDGQTGERNGYLSQAQDITEKKSAQEAARRNDELFRQFFNCSPIGLLLYDSQGQLVDANRAALDMFGVSDLRSILGFNLFSDPQIPAEVCRRLQAGSTCREQQTYDFDAIRTAQVYETTRTGVAFLDAVITPFTDGKTGQCTGYAAHVQDITVRKSAQDAARRSDEMFRQLFACSPVGMFLYDARGRLVNANRAGLEIVGISDLGPILGRDLFADPQIPAGARAHLETGVSLRYEATYDFDVIRAASVHETVRTGTGHMDAMITPLIDGQTGERTGYVVQVRDITERKRAEAQVVRLSMQRQLALDAARMGWWHYDLATRQFTWDDRVRAIWELEGHQASREEIMARVHPEDVPRVEAGAQIVFGRPHSDPYSLEYRIRLPGGAERWVENVTVALFEGHGESRRPVALFGTSQDITERKRNEATLRESRQEFENLLQSLEDGIWAAMPDGRYLYLNPAMERIYGLPLEKLFANPGLWLEAVHPEDQLRARESGVELLGIGRADIEYRILRPDGGVRWIRDRKSVVRNADGRPLRIGGIIRDITNRIEANVQAEQHRAQLKSLATALTLTEERERRRLAASVHDDLVQILGLIQIKLADLKPSSRGPNKAALNEIEGLVNRSVQTSRSLTLQLSPPVLYDLGFTAAAEWLAEDMKSLYGISISVMEYGRGPPLDEPRRVVLFQCLREALVNAAKHAGTPSVRVRINRSQSAVRVAVRDRGVGFEPAEVSRRSSQHFGLFSIRERLEPMGGRLVVRSAPGRGTTIFMTVPCSDPEVSLT